MKKHSMYIYLLSISMYISYNKNKMYIIIICDMTMKTCKYILLKSFKNGE